MRNVILGEPRNAFRNDVSTALLLESYPLQITMVKNFEELLVAADQKKDAMMVVSDSLMEEYDTSRVTGRTVYGYATTPDGIRKLQENQISCMGLIKTSAKLLETLVSPSISVMERPAVRSHDTDVIVSKGSEKRTVALESSQRPISPRKQNPPTPQDRGQTENAEPAIPTGMPNLTPEQMMQMIQMFQMMQGAPAAPAKEPLAEQVAPDPTDREPAPQEDAVAPSAGRQMKERRSAHNSESADAELERDILEAEIERKQKAKVISVYAAKGGVGKTSIASELAVCLALTSNGRRRFRVCIVDYNIDFGDIASTLELDDTGVNMTYWASEIREMLSDGKDPEEIQFSRHEMESNYLQQMPKTGLYALVAPTMHEDSLFIHSVELQVMLRNIIENGEFDYIICDTGNNTRDSSVIAMDNADYILLIATQDVTTANCNASVLRTLKDTGFNTDKVRLIINNVMPARETGISVQEVEETFPYICVCRIKRTPDIIRANNLGKPLVYNPKHDYTKQIQRIVRFVTSGEVIQEDPKRGFFGRSKKRKEE